MTRPYALVLLSAAACAPVEMRAPDPSGPCAVGDLLRGRYIGQAYRNDMRGAIGHEANARVTRVIHADEVTTMEFREDRLTIVLDDGNRIEGLRCG